MFDAYIQTILIIFYLKWDQCNVCKRYLMIMSLVLKEDKLDT